MPAKFQVSIEAYVIRGINVPRSRTHVRLRPAIHWMCALTAAWVLVGLPAAAQEAGAFVASGRAAVGQKDPPTQVPKEYELGPEDQLSIWVADAPDISGKPVSVDLAGAINLPLVGRIKAAGLTTQQLETELEARLKEYYVAPQVVISISEFRSQPVSVIGAVNQPGVHQLRGRKRLVEVLSMAGGIRTDAGYTVKITRGLQWGPIPLPAATTDSSGQYSVAEVPIREIMGATNPQSNILIRPNDVISVPRGELIYVVGNVVRAGGFVLGEQQTMTVLQALSMAGGLSAQAAGQNARILSKEPDRSTRVDVPVNIKEILAGKAKDVPLKADDILFIPNSASKRVAIRLAETALQTMTGIAIWRAGAP
jgi:polysaccharide biosynthesis/export protein